MPNQCKNILTLSTQDRDNYLALREQLLQTYPCKLLRENSAFGLHTLRINFFSTWTFPLRVFQRMTARKDDPNLRIEVFCREESMSYVGHYRYRAGHWQQKPNHWEDVTPEELANLGVSVTFSRRYDYTEQQMTQRLGYTPSSYEQLRLYEAQNLAWEDLRKEFRQKTIAPERKSFTLSATIHKPEQHPTEATSE